MQNKLKFYINIGLILFIGVISFKSSFSQTSTKTPCLLYYHLKDGTPIPSSFEALNNIQDHLFVDIWDNSSNWEYTAIVDDVPVSNTTVVVDGVNKTIPMGTQLPSGVYSFSGPYTIPGTTYILNHFYLTYFPQINISSPVVKVGGELSYQKDRQNVNLGLATDIFAIDSLQVTTLKGAGEYTTVKLAPNTTNEKEISYNDIKAALGGREDWVGKQMQARLIHYSPDGTFVGYSSDAPFKFLPVLKPSSAVATDVTCKDDSDGQLTFTFDHNTELDLPGSEFLLIDTWWTTTMRNGVTPRKFNNVWHWPQETNNTNFAYSDLTRVGSTDYYRYSTSKRFKRGQYTYTLYQLHNSQQYYPAEASFVVGGPSTNVDFDNFSYVDTWGTSKHHVSACKSSGRVKIQGEGGNGSPYYYSYDGKFENSFPINTTNWLTAYTSSKDIYIHDHKGCSTSRKYYLNPPPTFKVNSFTIDTPIPCNSSNIGDNEGTIKIDLSGGIAPYTYKIYYKENGSNKTKTETVDNTVYSYTRKEATNIYYRITDASEECPLTTSTPLDMTDPPAIGFDFNRFEGPVCPGDDVTIFFDRHSGSESYNIYDLNNTGNFTSNDYISNLDTNKPYEFEMTDGKCKAQLSKTTPNGIMELEWDEFDKTFPSCTEAKNGSLRIIAKGGTGSHNFYFDESEVGNKLNITGELVLTGLKKTYYNFTLVDAEGCSLVSKQVVDMNGLQGDGIKINSLLPNEVFCETDASGTIQVNSTSTRTTLKEYRLYDSKDNLVGTPQTSPNFTNLPTDSYKVVAVDDQNCESDKATSINIRADRVQITLDPSDIKPNPCPGKSLAEAKATASLGDESTNNYDFELWKDGSLVDSHNGGTSHTFAGLESEEYTYRVKDDRNCTAETKFTPGANSTPVTLNVLEVKDQLCDGDSSGVIKLSASSIEGAIDSIVDGVGNVYKTGAVTIPKLTAGTYYFDAYDVVGCGDNAEVVINNLNNIPQFTSVTFDSAACDNASNVKLEVGLSQPVLSYGDFDIQLHQAGNLIDQQIARSTQFEGLTNKTYSLEVIDSVGCSHDTTITIPRIKTPVNFSMQIDSTSCDLVANGKVALRALGGTSDVQYKFKLEMNGETDSVMNQVAEFSELPAGESFRISLFDQYGCSQISPIQYMHSKKQTLNIALNSFVNPTCPDSSNGSINMTALYGQGNNGEFTYYLKDYDTDTELAQQPGIRSYNFKDVPRGRFALGVQDSVGCYAQTELPTTLEEPMPIQVDMAANYIRKKGENTGWVQAQIREGNGKYNYEWYRDNSLIAESNTTTAIWEENLLAGTYKLRVQDSAGCTFNGVQWLEDSIVIPEPEFNLAIEMQENKRVQCYGMNNGKFTLQPVGGWGPDYLFGIGDTSNMQSSPVFENLQPKTYTVFIKDTAGVLSSADFIMTEPEVLTASLINSVDARCSNENSGEAHLNVSGGNGQYSIYATNSDTVTGTSHYNVPAGNQIIYAIDSLGCSAPVNVFIDKPLPVTIIDSTITKTKCLANNGSIEVEVEGGTPGYQYTWPDSVLNISNNGTKVESLYSGVYALTVTDNNDCNFDFDFYVSDISDLKLQSLQTQAVNCYGGSDGKAIASVLSSNDYTVVWPDDSEGPMASNLSSGTYTLRVYDSEGCKLFEPFTIDSPDSIYYQLNSLVNPTCFGVQDGEIHLEATGGTSGYSYRWSNGKNMRNLNNVDTGNYVVTITDNNQCQRSFAFDLDYSLTLTTNLEDEMTICHNNIYPISIGSYRFYEWNRNGEYLTQDSICYADEAGEYVVDVEDEQGCLATDSITIHMSEAVQTAQFLMATEVYQGDTVVIFEVSDPMPDSIRIIYPEGIEQVDSGQYYRHIYVPDTGTFEIELISYMLDCQDITTKKLYVMPRDEDLAWMKSSRRKIIKSFKLTPNPNHGDFDIEVELFEKHDATVRLLSFGEGIVYDSRKMQNAMHYTSHYHLNNVKPGVYLLNLTAGEEMKNIKFIIY